MLGVRSRPSDIVCILLDMFIRRIILAGPGATLGMISIYQRFMWRTTYYTNKFWARKLVFYQFWPTKPYPPLKTSTTHLGNILGQMMWPIIASCNKLNIFHTTLRPTK
jgi:hypothetical protein